MLFADAGPPLQVNAEVTGWLVAFLASSER